MAYNNLIKTFYEIQMGKRMEKNTSIINATEKVESHAHSPKVQNKAA